MTERVLGRNKPTPEERASLERRQLWLIERRHRMAVAGLRIEQILRNADRYEPDESLLLRIEKELSDIDPALRPTYLKAADRFFQRRRSSSAFFDALIEARLPGYAPESVDETLAGTVYSHHVTGARPHGTVRLRKTLGCLLLIADRKRDFDLLAPDDDSTDEGGDRVGQWRDERLLVNGRPFVVTIVAARADSAFDIGTIIAHELQHAVNNDFIGGSAPGRDAPFSLTDRNVERKGEPDGPARARRAKRFRLIKDEVLAFVRENAGLKETLRDIATYHGLYKNFPDPRDQNAARKLTRDIIQSLATTRLWDAGPHGRALLVNLLYPISLERLPMWIPAIRSFYKMHLPGRP